MHRPALTVLAALAVLSPSGARPRSQAEPRPVWQSTIDVEGRRDFARAVAVVKRRVIAAGFARVGGETEPIHAVDLVAGFRAGDGRRLWARRYATGRLSLAGDPLPHDRRRVYLVRSHPSGVEALFARTGATAWTRDEERAPPGGASGAYGAVLANGTLYVGGTLADEEYHERSVLQALDARSGALFWERWEPWSGLGAGAVDRIHDVDHADGRLAAVGVLGSGAGAREETLVAVYDAVSGEELWRRVRERHVLAASAVAASREAVFVAGGERPGHGIFRGLIVEALAASDGTESWRARPPGADPDSAYLVSEIVVRGGRLVVAGTRHTRSVPFVVTAFVVVLDADDGAQRWYAETELTQLGLLDQASVDEDAIYLVGRREGESAFVRALELPTGATLWEIASPGAHGVATRKARRLFAAGAVDGDETKLDFAVSGYRLPSE